MRVDDESYNADIVDDTALQREQEILENSTAPIEFVRVTEESLKNVFWIESARKGRNHSIPYERLLQRYQINNETYYLSVQEGIATGYIGQIHFTHEAIQEMMLFEDETLEEMYQRIRTRAVIPEQMLPFVQGLNTHVNMALDVRQSLPQSAETGYKLMRGYIDLLQEYAQKGIIIENLYGMSRTEVGIRCCQAFNFIEAYVPSVPHHRFKLDLLTSECAWVQAYQKLVFTRYPELKDIIYSKEHRERTHIDPFVNIV